MCASSTDNCMIAPQVDNLTSGILSDSFLMNVAETSRKVSGRGFIEDQYHLVFEESARSCMHPISQICQYVFMNFRESVLGKSLWW